MGKYKILKMNTGFGEHIYSLMLYVGDGQFVSSMPVRYYKTRTGALRAIKKKGGSLI